MRTTTFRFVLPNTLLKSIVTSETLNLSDSFAPSKIFSYLLHHYCMELGYSFIAYADPHATDAQITTSLYKKISINKKRSKRRARVLISLNPAEEIGLLEVRRFLPDEPGFIFAPYNNKDNSSSNSNRLFHEQTADQKLMAFRVDLAVAIDEVKLSLTKKGKKSKENNLENSWVLSGKWSYPEYENSFRLVQELQVSLVRKFEEHLESNNNKLSMASLAYVKKISVPTKKNIGSRENSNSFLNHPYFNTSKKNFVAQVGKQVKVLQTNLKKRLDFYSYNELNKLEPGLRKVVLSKVKTIPLANDFNPVNTFYRLIYDFPNSFVNWVADKKLGTWIGASPEILITSNTNKIFKTVSLAGTRWDSQDDTVKLAKNESLKQSKSRIKSSLLSMPTHKVLWSEKEIAEQSVTSRFIIDCFKTLRLREYLEDGPHTVQKGNLLHLQSEFSVDVKRYFGETLPYDMLALLHPTPAICGTPRTLAQKEINRTEQHSRSFYAGYLGPVEVDGEINIYVNLRCMEFIKPEKNIGTSDRFYARLYAGCGINEFSNPNSEWEETEAKLSLLIENLFWNNSHAKKINKTNKLNKVIRPLARLAKSKPNFKTKTKAKI